MNAEALAQFDREIEAYAAHSRPYLRSVLVQHRGEILSEHYWRGYAATSYQPVHSITKSVTSALIGLALGDRKLTLNDTLAKWFPEMGIAPGAHAALVTVRHLLTMTGGFQQAGRIVTENPITVLLRREPAAPPGVMFYYSNEDVDILAAIAERAVGEPLIEYAHRRLFEPVGIWRDVTKSNQKKLWKADRQGRVKGWRGLHLTTREMAAFGQLYLQRGRWEDQPVILPEYVAESTTARVIGAYPEQVKYGYLWWVSTDREGRPAFFTSGAGGQYVYVVPALDLVIAFTSTLTRNMDGRPHRAMITRLVSKMFAASVDR